jgi:hypothetical protein
VLMRWLGLAFLAVAVARFLFGSNVLGGIL